MNKFKSFILAAALVASYSTFAQVSPHETVTQTFGGNKVSITYGRPYSKKPGTQDMRVIWGKLVPYNQPWRMGADQATTLEIEKPIAIGDKTIPAGKYTLYMVLDDKGDAKLAISSKTGQWGIPVDEKHDVARVEMKKSDDPRMVDQFTISLEPGPNGGMIKAAWEKTAYTVGFSNKPSTGAN